MFHIFNRIYFAPDHIETKDCLVVVISNQSILNLNSKLQKQQVLAYFSNWAEFFKESKLANNFFELFKFLSQKDQKIFVLCDPESLQLGVIAWLTFILKNSDRKIIETIYQSYLFRYKMFYQSFMSNQSAHNEYLFSTELNSKQSELNVDPKLNWSEILKPQDISVEFLLATYLVDKKFQTELKVSIARLLKKDLEKYLFELKEIMLVHLLHKKFMKQFNLNQNYNLNNFQEIVKKSNPEIQVFFDDHIWNSKGMARHSSGKNINFNEIKPKHILALKKFNEFAAGEWGEEGIYKYVKSDVSKLDFISLIQAEENFDIDKLIDVEKHFTNAAGSFFSIDLTSVNHYLINHIFNLLVEGDTEQIKKFSLT